MTAADPMAAIPEALCPENRSGYAIMVSHTNAARARLRDVFADFNEAKACVVECQRNEADALASLVAESKESTQ